MTHALVTNQELRSLAVCGPSRVLGIYIFNGCVYVYCPMHTRTAVVLSRQKYISLVVGFSFCSYAVVGKIRNVYGCSVALESGVTGIYTGPSSGNLK